MAWGKITARLLVFLRSSTCVANDWEPRIELRPVERWPSGRRQRFAKPNRRLRRNPVKRREIPRQHWRFSMVDGYCPLLRRAVEFQYGIQYAFSRPFLSGQTQSDTIVLPQLSHNVPSKLLVALNRLLWYSEVTIVESTINPGGSHGSTHYPWLLSRRVLGAVCSDYGD